MAAMDLSKMMDTFGDTMKVAANLTDVVKKDTPKTSDENNSKASNTSNPNQTVQIQIADEGRKKDEPVVIHEKPETHIHKDFPDNRALTDKECELALQKAKMENELKTRQMELNSYREEIERKDRLAREAQERKDAEERRIRNEKKGKVHMIFGGIVAALGAGLIGYSIWSDSKKPAGSGTKLNITAGSGSGVIHTEGSVE